MKTSLGAKTLLYPAPVMVVGTYNENGQANVMTAAWGGRLVAVHELGLHTQFIGEVMDVKVDEMLVTNKQQVNIERLDPILFAPDSGLYYGLGTLIGEAFSIGKELVQHKDKA